MIEIFLIVLLAVAILVSFGIAVLFYKLRGMTQGQMRLFQIKDENVINDLLKILRTTRFPFILEIAVHHLGKEKNYYLAAAERYEKQLLKVLKKRLPQADLREAEDYYVFHHDGEVVAAYAELNGEEKLVGFDWSRIDFSKVNEVGEGAVVQVLFNASPKKAGKGAELRLMASAPSLYQAKEILDAMTVAFAGLKLKTPQNINLFIHKLNFREP